jgi:hypothetical protein
MDLRNILANLSGGSFIGLDTETLVPLTGGKSNPMQGRITKQMIGATVMAFQDQTQSSYNLMVKRRLIQENKNPDSFVVGVRAWGSRVPNLPLVEHNGQLYLEVIFLRAGTVEYFLDGVVINPANIIGLKDVSKSSDHQGLDNKVIVRDYKESSIMALRINGQEYR